MKLHSLLSPLLRQSLAALSAIALAFSASAETKWDMPTPYPVSNFHTENIQQFAADVDAATGGRLKITVHANGALYKANEIKRAVQGGQAQIGEIIISGASNEDPLFALDTIPFLASSYPQARALWQASRAKIEERFARQGLKVLFSVPWPPQGIYSKVALNSSADLKGVKIRSYSPTVARMIELMGAQPVTVQAAELTQALTTGVVSANITSASTGYDSKSWEQLGYYFDVQAWLPKNVVIVNQKQFDSLDKATRDALLKAGAAAELRGWKTSEEKTLWYVEQLKKNNMKVLPASADLHKDLVAVGDRMTKEWLEQAGADGQQVYDAYRKAIKK
ncbi:MAG: TRAP transporter substrate-binding protein [Candidatus Accumulibacter sp.]|uniref:TRAP transporter substrate-binding protein n=1 Tax=Accumulibacter sp. TaxID=2053492 RepID=UPI0019F7C7B0|nr:TRAP transporter substrate-binding protein [Accumulibacter sp.]MBE2257421.1 TRAP transporter substrate-binding protein [Paracoccaceae bacterium]MCB1940808.1 TRAP transporter substrate-binding protein [Accumulibacter sp.]MCP5248684.1 TRAP transporter substrate-binding protein [Accumulibacter sp.]